VSLTLTDVLKDDKEVKRTVLAKSTQHAWLLEGDSIELMPRSEWSVPGYNGPYTLAVALEGKLPSAFADQALSSSEGGGDAPNLIARSKEPVRVLVFGSGYFMHEAFLPKPDPGMAVPNSAAALALNAIDWLAQDSDLIEIRAKNVEDPLIEVPTNVRAAEATIREAISEQDEDKAQAGFEKRKAALEAWDDKKRAYRLGNTLGVPFVFALFGILRWRMRRARKITL